MNWVEFLQNYSFVLKHRIGSSNWVADSLSRRSLLLNEMRIEVAGFDFMRELYAAFKEVEVARNNPTERDTS